MTIVKHAQWADLQKRADLPETDPDHLSREVLQSLFFGRNWPIVKWLGERLNVSREQILSDLEDYRAGRLVRREESATVSIIEVPPVESAVKTASTAELVQAMLRAGVHKHAQRPDSRHRGMTETEWADLIPKEVAYPTGYADRYPHLLLVDQTLKLDELKACADANFYTDPAVCSVLSGVPKFLLGNDGKRLKRAVVFWGYERCLGLSVQNCRQEISVDNIPLIHSDGCWIIIQHRDGILRRHAIDLLGSRCAFRAPCVGRLGRARPGFSAYHVEDPGPLWGPGFRGSEVVSVP